MNQQIILVLSILIISQVLLITGKLRADLIAVLILITLAASGLVSTEAALAGFSNPAVTTVWAMFIISAGLSTSGVSGLIGLGILKLSNNNHKKLLLILLICSAILSAFMNNIAVAALLLPVTLDISRKVKISPSYLLMPMSFSILLGGLLTLIGTPSNLIASAILKQFTESGFSFFYQSIVGLFCVSFGIAFMYYFSDKLLINRKNYEQDNEFPNLSETYQLQNNSYGIKIPQNSWLIGKSISESHFSKASGLSISCIKRGTKNQIMPESNFIFSHNDYLITHGDLSVLKNLKQLELKNADEHLIINNNLILEVGITSDSDLISQTLAQSNFFERFGAQVIGVRRSEDYLRELDRQYQVQEHDTLLLIANADKINKLKSNNSFKLYANSPSAKLIKSYGLKRRILSLKILDNSEFINQSVLNTKLNEQFGLKIIQIIRTTGECIFPSAKTILQANDEIILTGNKANLNIFLAIKQLEWETVEDNILNYLRSDEINLIEVALAPRSNFAGKSIKELNFAEKFGYHVLSVWRGISSQNMGLANLRLNLGDGLLLQGPKKLFSNISKNSDLIILSKKDEIIFDQRRAFSASFVFILMLLSVIFGIFDIEIATIIAAVFMIICGCLTLDEAYQAVDLKAIILIAGTLPLGTALQTSGAADLIANTLIYQIGSLGQLGILTILYSITCLLSLIIPNTALIVVMAPIAIQAANTLQLSPQVTMLIIAIATSSSFASPFSHANNILVMGPGGYKAIDFIKLGIPLALLTMLITFISIYLFYI